MAEALGRAASSLHGGAWSSRSELTALIDSLGFSERPVARSGLECALLDAWRGSQTPLCTFLTGAPPRTLRTDMTLPIAAPEHMAELALQHRARGFDIFKVKIGKSIDETCRPGVIAARVPDARFRLDANAAFEADQALWLLDQAQSTDPARLFEQPCARDNDWKEWPRSRRQQRAGRGR